MRVLPTVKETYQQIDETTYQQINPYVEAIGRIRSIYPNARIIKTKTVLDVIGSVQYPELHVYFEVE